MSDLGLGLTYRHMREKLESWGYAVTQEGCRDWLEKYRFAMNGNVGIKGVSHGGSIVLAPRVEVVGD